MLSTAEKAQARRLVIGRLLRMMSRPSEPGDIDEYHRLRGILLDLAEAEPVDYAPNWVRDRLKGAQGD